MARKQDSEPSNPAAGRPAYDAIVGLTDAFCRIHLNAEYEAGWGLICVHLAGKLGWQTSTFPWERFDAVHPDLQRK